MAEYGVTANGINIKSMEVIRSEIHSALTEGWQVNTRANPQSFLNVLVTNFADKLAELWSFGAGIYYAMYPSSAEGANLDNAVQYSGIQRLMPEKSYYSIRCRGVDGTLLPAGTRVSSIANPVTYLSIVTPATIQRSDCNEARIQVVNVAASTEYSVTIDTVLYKIQSGATATAEDIIDALAAAINGNTNVTVEKIFVEGEPTLNIVATSVDSAHNIEFTPNLTTETVVTIVQFATEQSGDIDLPDHTITNIATGPSALHEVWNAGGYVPGRLLETDTELRRSYLKKIFHTSERMTDSIASQLMNDVHGVTSAVVFENDTDWTTLTYTAASSTSGSKYFLCDGLYYSFSTSLSGGDKLVFNTGDKSLKKGDTDISTTVSTTEPGSGTDITDSMVSDIWPHSIEVVVSGGDNGEVARTIFDSKSAGINTFGSREEVINDSHGNPVTVRFTRPTELFLWFDVRITASATESMPSNYVSIIRSIVQSKMSEADAGAYISPQKWLQDIFNAVSGIAYIEIRIAPEADMGASPIVYTKASGDSYSGLCYIKYSNLYYKFTMPTMSNGDRLIFNPADSGVTLTLVHGSTSTAQTIESSTDEPTGTDMRDAFFGAYTYTSYQAGTRERPSLYNVDTIGVTVLQTV